MKLLAISTLLNMASAAFGPMSLFNAISTSTFTQGDYTVKPYLDVKNGNSTVGVFSDYVIENGAYAYQMYAEGDSSIKLFIVCGDHEYLGPVSHYQPNKYQAILELPAACGVDFKVGNEFVAPTPTSSASNGTAIAAAPSTSSSTAALALGALGVSGAMIVVIMQVVKAIRTKGGLGRLLKGNMGKVNSVLDKAMKNVPLSDEMKKNITSMVDKQAESLVGKIDDALDQKMKGVRGEENDVEAAKNLIGLITKKDPEPQPEIVVATELPAIPEAEETENKN